MPPHVALSSVGYLLHEVRVYYTALIGTTPLVLKITLVSIALLFKSTNGKGRVDKVREVGVVSNVLNCGCGYVAILDNADKYGRYGCNCGRDTVSETPKAMALRPLSRLQITILSHGNF